jgi:1-acyl-sn-glycerol-3-phosphate acyltransferase
LIRSIVAIFVLLLVTPPLSLATIFGALFGASDRTYDALARAWCRSILWASGVPILAEKVDHIPRDRPVVILSNHESWLDVVVLAVLVPQRFRFVAKQELRRIPLWGRAWQAAGHISIDRQDTQRAIESLRRAEETVRSDNSAVIIFPEGTRAVTDEMLPFKKGGFRLALSIGADIVPVGIEGSREALPRDSWRLRRRLIIVRFGVPIRASDYGEDRIDELMMMVRGAIDTLRHPPDEPGTEDHAGDHEHSRA